MNDLLNSLKHWIFKFIICRSVVITGLILCLLFPADVFTQSQAEDTHKLLKKINDQVYVLGDIEINLDEGFISFPCTINMTTGLIEVLLCRKEGKVHESLLVTNITPLEFQTAMLLSGFDPVNELPEDSTKINLMSPYKTIETPCDSVHLFIEYEQSGKKLKKPAEFFLRDERTKSPLNQGTWLFKGAVIHQSDHVIVDNNVTMISTYADPVALMELNSSAKLNDELFYVHEGVNLIKGQPVKLIIHSVIK